MTNENGHLIALQIKPDGTIGIDIGRGVSIIGGAPLAWPPRLEWSATLCDGKAVDYATAKNAIAALGPGWRFPERMELESIIDLTRCDPAVDTTPFPDTKSTAYWTSTECAWAPSCVWVVYFNYGYADYNPRYGKACVRAVRAVPAGQ